MTGRFSILLLCFIALVSCQQEKVKKDDNVPTATPEKPADVVDTIPISYIIGKFDPANDERFTRIEEKYADRPGMYMRTEAYQAFEDMFAAAEKDGIRLQIRSATRNFHRQKQIWEAKWSGKRLVDGNENLAQSTPDPKQRALKILRWSSMPGTSRHHWGTDIDLNAFDNAYFTHGEGKKIYDWLIEHAPAYGFCQPYTPKDDARPDGYNEERWHWSYMPLAKNYLQSAKQSLSNTDISGFEGSETASSIDVKKKYILGIAPACSAH